MDQLVCPECGSEDLDLCERTVVYFRVKAGSTVDNVVVAHDHDDVDSQRLYCNKCECDWEVAGSVEYQ